MWGWGLWLWPGASNRGLAGAHVHHKPACRAVWSAPAGWRACCVQVTPWACMPHGALANNKLSVCSKPGWHQGQCCIRGKGGTCALSCGWLCTQRVSAGLHARPTHHDPCQPPKHHCARSIGYDVEEVVDACSGPDSQLLAVVQGCTTAWCGYGGSRLKFCPGSGRGVCACLVPWGVGSATHTRMHTASSIPSVRM